MQNEPEALFYYFYPDNPKNYQITQFETPIGYDGYVEININGKSKKIELEEIHIEEDKLYIFKIKAP